jgi:transcriptional regulator with XRE-family HTH domain
MGGLGSGRRTDPARRRKAEALRQGLTLAEIGRRLGVSRQNVWYLLHHAGRHGPDVQCAHCRRALPGGEATGKPVGSIHCIACLEAMPDTILAQRLRSLRSAPGLTRAALEGRAKVAHDEVIKYERGERKPSPATLVRLARVLGPGLVDSSGSARGRARRTTMSK